jgi:PAS domain S-box-containing protein
VAKFVRCCNEAANIDASPAQFERNWDFQLEVLIHNLHLWTEGIFGMQHLQTQTVVTPLTYRTILENMRALVQVLSPKVMIVYASMAHEKLGYSSSDLIGKSMADFYHPSDVAVLMRELKHTESINLDMMLRLKQRSGQYAWFQSAGSVRTDHGRRWVTLTLFEQHVSHLNSSALSKTHERSTNYSIWVKLSTSGLILHIFGDSYKPLGLSANDHGGDDAPRPLEAARRQS